MGSILYRNAIYKSHVGLGTQGSDVSCMSEEYSITNHTLLTLLRLLGDRKAD